MEPNMKLPEGKQCSMCADYVRCEGFFGCKPTNVSCDWSPSHFRIKMTPEELESELDVAKAELESEIKRFVASLQISQCACYLATMRASASTSALPWEVKPNEQRTAD